MRHADQEATIQAHKNLAEQEKIDMSLAINDVAAEAWNATKDKADPAFNDSIPDHRQKLITHAQSVKDKGVPSEGATDFDKKVAELLAHPDKTEAAIKKSHAAELQAQSDALAVKAKELAAEAKAK
jgi:aspartate/tyrosine/aromatic aminotransferase